MIPEPNSMSNFNRINYEVRNYPQWVNWRYEDKGGAKPTKVPYCPQSGRLASVIDRSTWVDFGAALSAVGMFDGLGFVLTSDDPFCGVDLDYTNDPVQSANQVKVYKALNSYSEKSPSGNGLHVICKAAVPSGRKRSSIELYSSHRYLTFTGDIYEENRAIEPRQEIISMLWAELSPTGKRDFVVVDQPEHFGDHEVIMKASAAHNGDFFKDLWSGNWGKHYPSQSEADYALINCIQFYSKNRAQIERLFLSSGLGQRDKAKRRDYIETMILRSFDRELPPVDLTQFKDDIDRIFSAQKQTALNAEALGAAAVPLALPSEDTNHGGTTYEQSPIVKPPGLMGEAADFFLAAANRPVPEAALAAAIGLMAGMCGRSYNTPTGAGLNLYLCLVAKTAIGKEMMSSGISKLLLRVEKSECPAVNTFLGPSEIRSDAALLRILETQPCCVSFMGEFGIKLSSMCAPNASSHLTGLRSVLLDLYGKSGEGNVLRPMAYSDTAKNTKMIYCPSFTILAEATPETFYPNLDEFLIAQGLLPRFMVIEYKGNRPHANEGAAYAEPSVELVKAFVGLAVKCLDNAHKVAIDRVSFTAQSQALSRKFDTFCDEEINSTTKDIIRNLWSRAHLKVMKLASLVAIGLNMNAPVIDEYSWNWAQDIIERDVRNVIGRFDSGDDMTGATGHGNQEKEVLRVIADYYRKPYTEIRSYMVGITEIGERVHQDRVIPYGFLQRRLVAHGAFKNDRMGSTNAIKRAIQSLVDSGNLQEIERRQLQAKYNISFRGFILSV
jgi:hypothetical protein